MSGFPGIASGGAKTQTTRREYGKLGIAFELAIRGQMASGTPGEFVDPTVDWLYDSDLNSPSQTGTWTKGANWQVYKDAVLALGASASDIIEDATTIAFRNTALARFLSLADIVLLDPFGPLSDWPGLTPKFVAQIKSFVNPARAARDGIQKCHVVYQPWKDDMPAGNVQSSLWNFYYNGFKAPDCYLLGDGLSAAGCGYVDADEDDPWPAPGDPICHPSGVLGGGGHNWMLDYRLSYFAEHAANLMRAQWDDWWSAGGPDAAPIDAYICHDILPFLNPRAAVATNVPTELELVANAEWRAKADAIFEAVRAAFPESPNMQRLWNGIGSITAPGGAWYPNVNADLLPSSKEVNLNFVFSSNAALADIRGMIGFAAERGVRLLILGNGNLQFGDKAPIFETAEHDDWWKLLATARAKNLETRTYAGCSQTGGRLFWHNAMRPVI